MDSDPIVLHILLQLFLLLLCSLLQAADTAVHTININKLRREVEQEDPGALRIEALLGKLRERPSGIQVGMTLLSFLGIVSATGSIGKALGNSLAAAWPDGFLSSDTINLLATFLVVLVAGFFYILIARALPAKLARRNAEVFARRLLPFTQFMDSLFKPIAWLVVKSANGILRLMRIDPHEETEQVTEDEIRMMVDAGEEKGTIEESERDMIENVFEFNNMTAEDCMTHRTDMYALWVNETDENILKTIEDTGLSRFPVYAEDLDHVIGTLTTRDYLMNRVKEKPLPLRSLLRPTRFVPETVRTDVLFRNMQKDKVHMAIVVDEYGGTSGLITMEDLLEEIVGNIYDEYDPQVQLEVIDKGNGSWRVQGSVEIEQFNDLTGLDLPIEEEYDTIGGLILYQLGEIPDEGTKPEVDFMQLRFKVEEVADRRIEWVLVTRKEPEDV